MFPRPLPGWKIAVTKLNHCKLDDNGKSVWELKSRHERIVLQNYSKLDVDTFRNESLKSKCEQLFGTIVRISPQSMHIDFDAGVMEWSAVATEI